MSRYGQKTAIGNPVIERQPQSLYARTTIQVAQAATYSLFTTATSDEARNFLTSAGQLNFPDKHYATGMSIWVPEDIPLADLILFRENSFVRLYTSNKQRVQAPTYSIPFTGHLQGQLAGSTDAQFVAGGGAMGQPYDLKVYDPNARAYVPLIIESQQSLKAEVIINAPAAFSAAFEFAVHLHGTLEVSA